MDVPAGPAPVKPGAEPLQRAFGMKRKNGVKNFSRPRKSLEFFTSNPEFPKDLGENEEATLTRPPLRSMPRLGPRAAHILSSPLQKVSA